MKTIKFALLAAIVVYSADPSSTSAEEKKSAKTDAEIAAEATQPKREPPPDPEREALKKRCAQAAKKGVPPDEECKTLELEIVFQGGIGPAAGNTGPRTVMQARDDETETIQQQPQHAQPQIVADSSTQAALAQKEQAAQEDDKILDLWARAGSEKPLFESEGPKTFSVGARAGYPLLFPRSSDLRKAYIPIIHLSFEVSYQPLSYLQVAVVGDFERLAGDSVATTEYRSVSGNSAPTYEDGSPRDWRSIGLLLDDQTDIGVRPTVRFLGEWRHIQGSLGLGLGWHYIKASGSWRAEVGENDRSGSVDEYLVNEAAWTGDDTAVYSFVARDHGIYAALELTLMYRVLGEHLGLGVMAQYSLLMHGAVRPNVVVLENYGLGDELDGYDAERDDYEETPVRHLAELAMLSLCAAAEYRF